MWHHGQTAGPRRKYSAARAFFVSILVISAIALWCFVVNREGRFSTKESHKLFRRGGLPDEETPLGGARGAHGASKSTDLECRLVRTAKDQCSFIRDNCPDEEAGLFSYLQLYYCKLPHAKPIAFTILTVWLGLLFSTIGIAASDFFCINLSTIANILGMSESMAGVTFLAFGNGSPDVFSTFAAMKTHSGSLAIGELIGAAGFITAVVAGSMALVRPFKVARKSFVRDVGFFIVAASFSMVFLADGHLHLWESAVMVGFYVFYVITVVFWHWYLTRKSRRREREAAARGHFHVPGMDEAEAETFIDDDLDGVAGGGRTPLRAPSGDDFANLERVGSPMLIPMDADADEETRDHWMAEISSNMRVSRPRPGERRNTPNPIRPSLVGALEFRAVLSSLQKSRNIQTAPIGLRRYSDDPTFRAAQQQDQISTASNPEINLTDTEDYDATSSSFLRPSIDTERNNANRLRASSTSGIAGLQIDPNPLRRPPVPEIDLLDATPPGTAESHHLSHALRGLEATQGSSTNPSTPGWSVSPPREFGYFVSSPARISSPDRTLSTDLLAPPGSGLLGVSENHGIERYKDGLELTKNTQEFTDAFHPSRIRTLSRPQGSNPASPFPEYHDDPNYRGSPRAPSLVLPPPGIGSESMYRRIAFNDTEDKPVRWWPYKALPPPQVLTSTLFPTLYAWHDKNIWERLLGIVAAPSVLLLAITLPVVEAEKNDDTPEPDPRYLTPTEPRSRSRSQSTTLAQLPLDSPLSPHGAYERGRPTSGSHSQTLTSYENYGSIPPTINVTNGHDGITSTTMNQQLMSNSSRTHQDSTRLPSDASLSLKSAPSSPKEWNRWLVATQIFTAPFFIVLLYWANNDPDLSSHNLLLPSLYGLIISLVLFAILLLTTTASKTPRYRYLFCFLGFVVSIAWISTIANEVVGVLKAFGVILGISDAILGLTIFAVGNSLGDLVADITVARLGYPVMALSACFGGPMLNILLGIGLSGLYMTIKAGNGRHERHPEKPMKYKPYQIDVGGTLIISGITLVVTLLGVLIVVPLNGWRMDRRIGWGLVALWCASTVGNVVAEIMGWEKDIT